MKVLSVRQPFAALLVLGVKRLEARGKNTSHRGPLLIHASSAAITGTSIEQFEESPSLMELYHRIGWTTADALRSLPRSAIIGSVNLVDSVPSGDFEGATDIDYELSAYPDGKIVYWIAQEARACEPIEVNGRLNVWDLPTELEEEVTVALANGRASRPAWTAAPHTGAPLVLREYRPTAQLSGILGEQPRAMREIFRDFFEYAKEHGLTTPTRLRVDSELSFLSPDRKFLAIDDVLSAVRDFVEPMRVHNSSTSATPVTSPVVPSPLTPIAPSEQPARTRGQFNSSTTRVAPIFDALRDNDHVNPGWIGRLLDLVTFVRNQHNRTNLDLSLVEGYWGAEERGLQAPVALLSWLIRNFSPPDNTLDGDSEVEEKRRKLAARDADVVEEAIDLLRSGGKRKAWYVLEGPTFPDAYLVTPDALIVVEGKRTEREATTRTTWMAGRHQMLRHIDAAWEVRGHRRVFGLMIVEGDVLGDPFKVSPEWSRAVALETDPLTLASSLPHRGPEEQRAIADAFLGATTWQAVAREFALPAID